MSLTGTFEDLSLSSLIQAICLERKKAALVVKRAHETGLIYLLDGNVIHADAGPLSGEKAFYYIFTWEVGEFHTNGFKGTVQPTIQCGWQELLLQGAKQKDEQMFASVSAPLSNAITPNERAREEQVEESLLELLAHLEQLVSRMPGARRVPVTALDFLAQITNMMLAAFDHIMSRTPLSGAASESTRRVLASQLASLPTQPHTGLLDVPLLLRTFQGVGLERRAASFSHISGQLLNVLSYSYLALLASCFRSPDLKAELNEAFHIFLADVQQALSQIQT
jgi:hypothetical protein